MTAALGESLAKPTCLLKSGHSDLRVVSSDCSQLFSMKEGAVLVRLALPFAVRNGVYARCLPGKFFGDYLVFMVNPADQYISMPGLYAAFTPDGIQFTVWTKAGLWTTTDRTTDLEAEEEFDIEFAWDWSGKKLGMGARAAIFVNGSCTAAGNGVIHDDDLSQIELTMLDNAKMDFDTRCRLCAFATFGAVPEHSVGEVRKLTDRFIGRRYVALVGRNGVKVWPERLSDFPVTVDGVGCPSESNYAADCCDISGDLYVASFQEAVPGISSVSRISGSTGLVVGTLADLTAARAVAVVQRDGIDFPKLISPDTSGAPYVWVADESRVLLCRHDLSVVSEVSGFSSPRVITPLSDGRAWVCDWGNNLVKLVNEDGTAVEESLAVDAPSMGAATVMNEYYVYSQSDLAIYKIVHGAVVASLGTGIGMVAFDVDPNSGNVLLAFPSGIVREYNRNLTFRWQSTLASGLAGLRVARGYPRRGYWAVDHLGGLVSRYDHDTDTRRESGELEELLFQGAICGPGVNGGTIPGVAGLPTEIDASMSSISNITVSGYKVDATEVDLSGGGDNETQWRDDGVERPDDPTDQPPPVRKGQRLPE